MRNANHIIRPLYFGSLIVQSVPTPMILNTVPNCIQLLNISCLRSRTNCSRNIFHRLAKVIMRPSCVFTMDLYCSVINFPRTVSTLFRVHGAVLSLLLFWRCTKTIGGAVHNHCSICQNDSAIFYH